MVIENKKNEQSLQALVIPAIRTLFDSCPTVFSSDFENYSKEQAKEAFIASGILGEYIEYNEDINVLYEQIKEAFKMKKPQGIIIQSIGVFISGVTKSDADYAVQCLLKGIKYEISSKRCSKPCGRLSQKVAIVTGSAQGFGEGIAYKMAEEGCHIIIADLNIKLAATVANFLNEKHGDGTALAVGVNVADEDSVKQMIETVVLEYGGLDIFVSNAGVVRAGDVSQMTVSNFKFVTDINYIAYFICVKYASIPMKIQAKFNPEVWTDIIQINSKSGLEGSNKNFAYAGSKFGGIGLTQSFALELAEHNIKVNSICPGNFYEGPLWSDPEKGLFVSYLKAGKIPGAKTVEDVREFYLAKSPIKRGCNPTDVTRAIFYCVEQQYETGQAIPVTGGQTMLK